MKYNKACPFKEGLAKVKYDRAWFFTDYNRVRMKYWEWGYINTEGVEICELKYIDTKGEEIIDT